MKLTRISQSKTKVEIESGDSIQQVLGPFDWLDRLRLTRHFLIVIWAILRKGEATHTINVRQVDHVALEDILDAEVIGD